jgi:hypothetical protein
MGVVLYSCSFAVIFLMILSQVRALREWERAWVGWWPVGGLAGWQMGGKLREREGAAINANRRGEGIEKETQEEVRVHLL